jgi:hypothetical protein
MDLASAPQAFPERIQEKGRGGPAGMPHPAGIDSLGGTPYIETCGEFFWGLARQPEISCRTKGDTK